MLNASYWLLLASLAYAPLAYGATRDWTIHGLNILLGAAFICWLVGWLWQRKAPPLAWLPFSCLGLLLLEAAWMTWNAHSIFDSTFRQFVFLSPPFPDLPGSADYALSLFQLERVAALIGAFCVAFTLIREQVWRQRMLNTLVFTALAMVLLGLAQKAGRAPTIYLDGQPVGTTFFATYRYHGNAGAYLNMVWPFAGAFLLLAARDPKAHIKRAVGALIFLLILVGIAANFSRMALGLTLIGLVTALVWNRTLLLSLMKGKLIVLVPLALVLVAAGIGAARVGTSSKHFMLHWSRLGEDVFDLHGRTDVYKVTWGMLPSSGLLGTGPGTFQAVFPEHQKASDLDLDFEKYSWRYTHEDYLQTLLEWGFFGAIGWALVLGGGFFLGIRTLDRNRKMRTRDALLLKAALLSLGLTALHALVDFPFQIASLQLYAAVLLALCWTAPQWTAEGSQRKRNETPDGD